MKFRMLVSTCIISAFALAPYSASAESDEYDDTYGSDSLEYVMASKFELIAGENTAVCDAEDPAAALLELRSTKKITKFGQKAAKFLQALYDINSKELKALYKVAAETAIENSCYVGDEDPDLEDPFDDDDSDFSDENPEDGGGEFFPPPPPKF